MKRQTYTCPHCSLTVKYCNISRHIKSCYLNPANARICPNCQKVYHTRHNSKTCSRSCANTLFAKRGSDHPNWKESAYRTSCFAHHKKQCIICGEDKIVSVHHIDNNKSNNSPDNLVPLCPTHHQYVHSKYSEEVQPMIDRYLEDWLRERELNPQL